MTKTMRLWAALVAVMLMLAACGGGQGATSSDATAGATDPPETEDAAAPTKDEWIDQAIAECRSVNEAIDASEPEGDPFAEGATDEDREAGVSYLRQFGEALATFSSNLRDFGFPQEDPDGAEKIVDAAQESAQAFDQAAATAEEDFAAAQPEVGQAFGSMGGLEAAAGEYGIGSLQDCEKEAPPAEEVAEGANEVPVVAVGEDGESYDFEFDQPVPAGQTAFVLDNRDDEPHFMFVIKITGDKSLDEILKAEQQGENPEEHAEEVGSSDEAGPGEQAVLNVENLEPGTYGMLCYIPAPDGEPHAYKGMAVDFEVE